jgi:hydrogenase nickel incorporation protein HypA/HybF
MWLAKLDTFMNPKRTTYGWRRLQRRCSISSGAIRKDATFGFRKMHELSVCQALLAQVSEIARAHRASGVKEIVVAVGPLSGVEPALLAGAFQLARTRSCAADAELRFEPAPVRVCCTECGAESACAANRLLCAQCGGYRTRLVSGDELRLLRVELLSADEQHRPSGHLN